MLSFPTSALWDFAIAVYHAPQVSAACLSLQEEHGVDVNVLLCLLWCGVRGVRASRPEEIDLLTRAVDKLHIQVTRALRGVRVWLKAELTAMPGSVRRPLVESLREAIKRDELAAERIELLLLEDAATALPHTDVEAPVLAAMNVEAYFCSLGRRLSATDERITTLVSASSSLAKSAHPSG